MISLDNRTAEACYYGVVFFRLRKESSQPPSRMPRCPEGAVPAIPKVELVEAAKLAV